MGFPKSCKHLSACSSLFSLNVLLFPWLGHAWICLFEGEGAQVCLSGHIGWAESVGSARQVIYICVSQKNKTPGAFYEAADPVPSHVMPPEAVIHLSGAQSPLFLDFPTFSLALPKIHFFFHTTAPRTSCSGPSCEIQSRVWVPSSWSAPSAVCATPTTLLSMSTRVKFSVSPKSTRLYSSCPHFWEGLLAINDYMKIGYHFHHFKGEMEGLWVNTDPN